MRIKNLYLKILSKVIEPTKELIEFEIDKCKQNFIFNKIKEEVKILGYDELSEEALSKVDVEKIKEEVVFSEEQIKEWREQAISNTTKYQHQLLNIRKNKTMKPLYDFVLNNAENINDFDKPIIVIDVHFKELLSKCNLDISIPRLDIYFSSNLVLCSIIPITLNELEELYKTKDINEDKYNSMKTLFDNYDKNKN